MSDKKTLTIYKNEMNTIPFRKFNAVEMNLFFAICTKMRNKQLTNFRSSYSKTMFRLLKQFRQTGYYKVSIKDFRYLLDIPKSYPMNKLTQAVLIPIQKELIPLFKNLKIEKIKAKKQNKIEYLEFSFTPQDDIKKDGTKIFKDKNNGYYENDIEHFTKEEVNKSFPTR